MQNTFNILSLSGGGIKGLFQASFLSYLEKEYEVPLYQMFDLVAGTSTGSIVGGALACGISLQEIVKLYNTKGDEIFNKKRILILRKSWYSNKTLKDNLHATFKDAKMNDCKIKMIIPTTSLDNGKHKIFTEKDDVSIVDALMSSAAAPYYFDAYKICGNINHSYLDGGLWANDPTLLAILYTIYILKIPIGRIRVLSIGTACMPQSENAQKLNSLRAYSIDKIKKVINTIFNSSENFSCDYSNALLPDSSFLHFSPTDESILEISIDDVKKAKETLPSLAHDIFDKNKKQLLNLLGYEGRSSCKLNRSNYIKEESILSSGLADFIPSRNFYRNSDKETNLNSYLQKAQKTIRIISVSLMNAISYHGLADNLERIIKNKNSIEITISLLDFEKDYLLEVMAPVLNKTKNELKTEISNSIQKLSRMKSFSKITLLLHNTIPFGTIIMLDEDTKNGSVIVETRPYGANDVNSFSYKLLNSEESVLFNNILDGCKKIDAQSRKITKTAIKRWKN